MQKKSHLAKIIKLQQNFTTSYFSKSLTIQLRHHSLQMLTEIVTSWISADTHVLYSAQETETFSKERFLRDLITERSLALDIQKKCNISLH